MMAEPSAISSMRNAVTNLEENVIGTVRLRSIDCLRGIAALGVSFGHALVAAPFHEVGGDAFAQFCLFTKWLTTTGVPLFFVVSGFCIHLSLARVQVSQATARFNFTAFWRRRIWRLYPTYFVVLCGSMALVAVMALTGTGVEIVRTYPEPRATWFAWDFVAHATMTHGLHPLFDRAGGNPPFWTLAREEYLYLMYPLILLMRSRLPWWAIGLLMASVTGTIEVVTPRVVAEEGWRMILTTSAPALWIQWYLGSVAADAYCGRIVLPRLFFRFGLIPLLLLAAYRWPLSTVWLALAYFTLLNACVSREARGHWNEAGLFGLVGKLGTIGVFSYSLYLINDPLHTVLLAISRRIGEFSGPYVFVGRAAAMTIASVWAAYLLFLLVERRFVAPAAKGIEPKIA
jgi:peptidoglycan/LPS O-acetylase OafA/YrhL